MTELDPYQLRDALDSLSRDLQNMKYRLNDLEEKTSSSTADVGRLEDRVNAVEFDVLPHLKVQLEAAIEETSNDVAEARAAVKGAVGRIQWLERHVRAAEGITPVDLDTADASLRREAEQAERGRSAKAALLSDLDRRIHESRLKQHTDALGSHRAAVGDAIRHSATVANTDLGDEQHDLAAAAFRAAAERVRATAGQVKNLWPAAQEAQQAIDADQEACPGHIRAVEQGDAAWTTVCTRLRTRITDAIGSGALLPVWFTTVLGHSPPATNTTDWMNTATLLLAYRITYGINDPVVALGSSDIAEKAGGHRWRLHCDISKAMAKLRSWP